MVRISNNKRIELLRAIGKWVQAYQDATDEVDEAAARLLGLNRTDLRCLSLLGRGAMTASELASAAGLTRGAMTTALDRIEGHGYARRVWHQHDRRSVRIELTEMATTRIGSLYGPLAQEGAEKLQKYSAQQLSAVLRYLEDGHALQRAHAERIRGLVSAAKSAQTRQRTTGTARRTNGRGRAESPRHPRR